MPMPEQPLKAVAVIVIAQKIAPEVLYGGGLAIGLVMLLLTLTGAITWIASVVPKAVVRGLQLGLGIQLAMIALKERPTIGAIAGALCIASGAALLARDQRAGQSRPGASKVWSVEYGLIIGVMIGIYTVWDKFLVGTLAINPLILEWVATTLIGLLVTPAALRNLPLARDMWRKHKNVAISGALLSSLSYILFLTALSFSAVSRVAPLRETSILIGALLGTRLLGEGKTRQRLAAAGAISAGVILVSIG